MSLELTIENLINTLVAAVLIQIFWKLFRKVVLMICRSRLNIGSLGSKARPQELKIENKFINTLVAAVLIQIFWKLFRKGFLMICRSRLNMRCIGSKTRSQELNIEKSY
jgi:predicted secreted protein